MGTKFPCLNLAKDFSSWVFNFGIFFTIAKNPKIKTQKGKRFRTFIGDIDGLHHSSFKWNGWETLCYMLLLAFLDLTMHNVQ